jgi:phosphatidate cytidylyltransferase
VLAVILAVIGIIGDLVESLLKRDAAVKDTGMLLPGTGGILDRVDSNLLAIPVMYYLMLAYFYFWVG